MGKQTKIDLLEMKCPQVVNDITAPINSSAAAQLIEAILLTNSQGKTIYEVNYNAKYNNLHWEEKQRIETKMVASTSMGQNHQLCSG